MATTCRRPLRSALFIALILAGLPSVARAQSGQLLVRVTSGGNMVVGATVSVVRVNQILLQGSTNAAGVARIVGVAGGTYQVKVEALGYRTEVVDSVRLEPGRVRTLEVRLEIAPVKLEGIAVRSTRIHVRRDNTEYATTVNDTAIDFLPVAYEASRLAALAPGSRAEHVWGGASLQANNYQIDGLSANHPGVGGSFIELSTDWIQRVEVRGLGAGAEYGGFQGGQVNVVTKSGTNDFHAMIRTSSQPGALAASNLTSTETAPQVAWRNDVEGNAGGPILPDRLFYYVGGAWTHQDDQFRNHLPEATTWYAPALERTTNVKTFGKLTWMPRRSDRVDVSAAYLNSAVDNHGMTGYEAPGSASLFRSPTSFVNAAWRHTFGDAATLEAQINRFGRDERSDPYHGTDEPGIRLFRLTPPYTTFGNAPFTLRSAPSSMTASLAGTLRLRTGTQQHLLKVGAQYSRGSFLERRTRNGGMTWLPVGSDRFDASTPATWAHPSDGYLPTEWGGEVRLDADVVNAAAFVQASISLWRLSLTPGVRWGMWEGWINPNAGARFRAVADQAVDPRIGAVLELASDGSAALKAHWGRYHQDMFTQMFDRAAGTDAFTNQEIWYYRGDAPTDPARTFTTSQRDALAAQGLFTRESVVALNETGPVVDYHQPYMDEWVVGIEKRIGWVKLGALYTRRSNHDMIALVDRNRATNYTRYEDVAVLADHPTADAVSGFDEIYIPNNVILDQLRYCAAHQDVCGPPPLLSFDDTLSLTWNPDHVLTNAPDARRQFGQLQLTITVARPRWGASLSAVATTLKGNLDNVSGYVDPRDYSPGPYVRVNEGLNAYGRLGNYSEREAKVSVWGLLPGRLRGGFVWHFRTGDDYSSQFRISGQGFYRYRLILPNVDCPWWQPQCPDAPVDPDLPLALFVPLEGHVVFIQPRGKYNLDARSNFDFRLERLFSLSRFDVGVALDVFNLLGTKAVTSVQTLRNNTPRFSYFVDDQGNPVRSNQTPDGEYYGAVLSRVPPREIRIGMTAYF